MKYRPLLALAITHGYHAGARCPDLRVVPSAESEALLRRHRLVLKAEEDGTVLLAPVDGAGQPLLPFAAGTTLNFDLRVENDDFPLFTDTSSITAKQTPVYTNAAGQTPLLGGALVLVDRQAGKPPRGSLAQAEIAGVESLVPSMTPAAFQVELAPRSVRWVYYVVSDLPAEPAAVFAILDQETSPAPPPVVFSAAGSRDLVASPDPADPIAVALSARYPSMRRMRFVSDAAVACSERARRYLELHVDGNKVMEALPNPSVRALSRIDIGSPPAPVDGLHFVIEHRAAALAAPAA